MIIVIKNIKKSPIIRKSTVKSGNVQNNKIICETPAKHSKLSNAVHKSKKITKLKRNRKSVYSLMI